MTIPSAEPQAPEGIEQRLRRGILLVAAAAVLITAVPLLILSIASGVGLEQRKSGFVAELIERNLRQRIQSFREEITGLAAAPILATGLTDNAGRQAYLAPFLKQRADATQSRLILFDYRGRPLLDIAEEASARQAESTRLPDEAVSLLHGDRLSVTAPIRFFANQRLIGGLEGQLPLRALIAEATRGLVDEYHVILVQGGTVVFATTAAPGPGDAAGMVTLRLDLPGEGPPMRIELRPRLGWFAPYFWRISLVMLCAVLAALLLALVAARRMARVLTAPIGALARASERFRAGEVPDLSGLQQVREIAALGEALAGAFRARDAAQAEAVRYTERMLEGLPVAVFHARADAAGGFALDYLSPGIARIAGWPSEALRDAAGWAASLGPGAAGFLRTAFREGEGLAELPVTRPDGQRIWLRERSRVIGRSPREVEVVGTLTDITVERALQAQAVSAGKLALLGEMATGLAHELSQPLAVMSLAAENAARSVRKQGGPAAGSVLGRLDRIIGQAARARGIVDHLRVFARRDEVVALEPVSLARALEGALTLVGGALRSAGIAVVAQLPPDLPEVRAALVPVEQVLVNLLINARDALGDPAPEGARIELGAGLEAGRVVLRLRDNGPGIPPEILERLFEPFFTTKEAGKGTGLGLSICLGTMRSFGGEITAANLPEGGAEFRLSFLPAEDEAAAPGPEPAAAPAVVAGLDPAL